MRFTVAQGNGNKTKNKQMGFKRTYKLLISKGNHKKKKWEKTFANDVTNKGLICKIHSPLI